MSAFRLCLKEKNSKLMTAEEYRRRKPTPSAGRKGHNSDSEDDLKGVYQAVEDDEDVVEDDDNDDDENFDDVNDDEDSELYEEDSEDLDSIRYDTGKRKKSKLGGSSKADQEEEVGPIERLSRKIQQKKEDARKHSTGLKSQSTATTKSSPRPGPMVDKKKKKGTGARMYELAEGVASSSALFGHSQQTKVARQEEKRRLSQPIAERLQSSGRSGDDRKQGEPAAKMRYMRDKATGFVRELTYVPEDSNRMTRKDSLDGEGKSSSGRKSSSTKDRKHGNSRAPRK